MQQGKPVAKKSAWQIVTIVSGIVPWMNLCAWSIARAGEAWNTFRTILSPSLMTQGSPALPRSAKKDADMRPTSQPINAAIAYA